MFARLYALFTYLGVMALPASFVIGFKYDPTAPASNYVYNVVLYLIYIGIHFVMTIPAFKKMVYGQPQGAPHERRIYVTVAIVTWIVVYVVHKPLPGFAIPVNEWVVYFGLCVLLVGHFAFFEFANFDGLNAMFGVPGAEVSHTAGGETPLMTEGSYSKVRHPMYRGAVILYLSSVIMHPNAAQLLWAVMVALSFVAFIPIEEAGLIKGRGDAYREYQKAVKWRVIPGIW